VDNHKGFFTLTYRETSVKYWGLRYLLGDIFSKAVRYYKKSGLRKTVSKMYNTLCKGKSIQSIGIFSSWEKEKCKVCNSGDLVLLEKRLNIHGIVDYIYMSQLSCYNKSWGQT